MILSSSILKNNVVQNYYVKYLFKDKKRKQFFYDIIVGVREATPQSPKWENILGDIDQEEWNSYNALLRDSKEVKLLYPVLRLIVFVL